MNVSIAILTVIIFTMNFHQVIEYIKLCSILVLVVYIKDKNLSKWLFSVLFIPVVIVIFVYFLFCLLT